jgi:hypothetical protein
MTREPAMANEEISTLNRPKIASPTNKNKKISAVEIIAAIKGLNFLPFAFMSRIMGMDPVMSITANKTIKALTISLNFIMVQRYKTLHLYHLFFQNSLQ